MTRSWAAADLMICTAVKNDTLMGGDDRLWGGDVAKICHGWAG